jgi:hypothetical protein
MNVRYCRIIWNYLILQKGGDVVRNRIILIALTGIFVLCGLSSWSFAGASVEFEANFTINIEGEETESGRIYVKGQKFRQEVEEDGVARIVISEGLQGNVLVILPEEEAYLKIPLDGWNVAMDQKSAEETLQGKAVMENLGKEKVNGYDCNKYRYTYRDPDMGVMIVWFSEKLQASIKHIQTGPSGTSEMILSDIKEHTIPDHLFEVPKGYQEMNIFAPGGK